jgi:hypothetical protein
VSGHGQVQGRVQALPALPLRSVLRLRSAYPEVETNFLI